MTTTQIQTLDRLDRNVEHTHGMIDHALFHGDLVSIALAATAHAAARRTRREFLLEAIKEVRA